MNKEELNWRERIKKGMLEYAKKWALPFTEENVMDFIKRCQKAQGYPLFTVLDEFYRCSCFGGEPITPGTIYFKDVPKEVADVLRVTVDRYDWLEHYFKTGKIISRSSNTIIELEPTKENLEQVEAQIKEASPDEQEKLLIFINNTRRTLGMPDYEEEISNEPESNPGENLDEPKYDWEDELISVGGRILPDETVWLYHATTKEVAKEILRTKILKTAPEAPKEYGIYAGSTPSVGFDYGDGTVVPIHVHAKDLHLDDIFPGRRADFMIEATRYKPIEIGEIFNVREIPPEELIKKYPLTELWVKDFYPEFRLKSTNYPENEVLKVPREETLKQSVDTLIRYHFGGFGNKMYFLSGYLAILKDPAFSEEEKESAKKNVPEVFAWIKRKYDQIPFSELSKSPFYDDLKPLFEINKLLSALEEELERKPLDFDKIESILSKIRGSGKEYTKAVDKYYRELTGKDLGAATVETRALMEYRSKEQIEDQARWLKEQGIEPNSFEKAAMGYYGVSIPKEKPPPEVKEKELNEEYARYIDRLRQLGVEIDKVPAIVEIGKTPTVIGKYDTYRLNFALGEISREDMPKFTTLTIKGKVWNVKKSTEAELLKIKLRKKLREEERREKQLKLREERRLETYEKKGDGEPISLRDKLQLAFLEEEGSRTPR